MKLLLVYNTCELGGRGNIPYYVDCIRSLLAQTIFRVPNEHKLVISACAPTDMTQIQLTNTFNSAISYNFIHANVPVSVSFNHSVEKMVEAYGKFDAYLYIDSGISFWDPGLRFDAVETLLNVHNSGPYAITAAMPSNDDGRQWWGIEYKPGEDYVFPIGKTTNMHCQFFSETWREAYGKVLPDIFASHCMESIFSHMAGAIRRKFILTQKIHLLHNHSMDGASIGSRAPDLDRTPMSHIFQTGGLLFKTKVSMDERYRLGQPLGMGIEECKDYWLHDPDKWDENGYAKEKELAPYIAKHFYLTKEEFNYDDIRHHFIRGQ